MASVIIICLLLIGAIVYSVYAYRNLIMLRKKVNNSWDLLDAALYERFSILPKFIVILQRLVPDKRDILQKGVDAVCYANAASTKGDKITADSVLRDIIDELFDIYRSSEADKQDNERIYPSLYILTEKISSLRQSYNLAVKEYNDKVLKYPSKLIALVGRFKTDIYYEVQISGKKEVVDSL